MKRRGVRLFRWGEGWLFAAVVALTLAFALAFCTFTRPETVRIMPVHTVDAEALRRTELMNINEADAEELTELPGIGGVLARRIVEWRMENGPFTSLEQLMEVEGLGEGKYLSIRDRVWLGEGV